ncbi:hypothetical protein ASE22_25670 [Sphingomonas sp. Root720]|nr:hypothetical protein ASE22_25670 [Sphingomonas sp. Root720]
MVASTDLASVLLWSDGRYVDEIIFDQHTGDLHSPARGRRSDTAHIQPEAAAQVAAKEIRIALPQQQTCLFDPATQSGHPGCIIERQLSAEAIRN